MELRDDEWARLATIAHQLTRQDPRLARLLTESGDTLTARGLTARYIFLLAGAYLVALATIVTGYAVAGTALIVFGAVLMGSCGVAAAVRLWGHLPDPQRGSTA